MDTSKTYIKMCEKAEEIQGIFLDKLKTATWEENHIAVIWGRKDIGGLTGPLPTREPMYGISWEGGEYFIYNGKICGEHCKCLLSLEDPEAKVIWLPRQDQLQGMVDYPAIEVLIDKFYYWARLEHNISLLLTSMEQLWLAYVMSERHRKVWSGKEWE